MTVGGVRLTADTPPTLTAGLDDAFAAAARSVAGWPAGQPVRLAKSTSNLFRPRSAAGPGLDLSAFRGVFALDPVARTAVVGGLTTYEDLVAATLPHGLLPLCVPQLRTITLGGAVTGLGIESASFRNGCPHESVLSMDVLTGTGEIIRAAPGGSHADLFRGFPNSYGSLGYALLLQIELEPAARFVALTHVPFGSVAELSAAVARIVADRCWAGEQVDFLDGTVFSAGQMYLTLGRYTDEPGDTSDYRGQQVYYRSIERRATDRLTAHDYIWRWDTDWFWCSRAFGAQNPAIRRLWPRRYLRSDVYWRIVAADRRWQISARADRLRGLPPREPVVQDIEVPLDAVGEFLAFFHREVGIAPIWLCPLRQRDPGTRWPLYSFDPETTYVNAGFWSSVARTDGGDPGDGRVNRLIEAEVSRLGGRKSLYSTSFYDEDEFAARYGGAEYAVLKRRYDPEGRFATMYAKCVRGM